MPFTQLHTSVRIDFVHNTTLFMIQSEQSCAIVYEADVLVLKSKQKQRNLMMCNMCSTIKLIKPIMTFMTCQHGVEHNQEEMEKLPVVP